MDDGTEVEVRWGPGEKFVLTVDDRSSDAKPETAPAPVVVEPPPAEGTTQIEQQRASLPTTFHKVGGA